MAWWRVVLGVVVLALGGTGVNGQVAQQLTPTRLPGIPGAVTPTFAFTPTTPSATPSPTAMPPSPAAASTATSPPPIAPATVTATPTLLPPPTATPAPTLPPTATRPPLPEQLAPPTLDDVLVAGDFVVSLPPWTIIRAAGFDTRERFVEAVQLAHALLLPIAPLDPALVQIGALAALRPVAIEGVPVLIVVGFFPLDALSAELDTAPVAFAPGQLLDALGYGTLRPLVLNGRNAAIGVVSAPDVAATPTPLPVDAASPQVPPPPALWQAATAVVFPQDNLVGLVLLQAPERYRDAEAFVLPILLSLRKANEPLDVAAVVSVLGIADATAVPPVLASATASPTPTRVASATATPSPSPTFTPTPEPCVLTAFRGANLRGGPGIGFIARGVLNVGQQATADAQTTNEGFVWWRLTTGVWVRSDLVREQGPCEALPTAR